MLPPSHSAHIVRARIRLDVVYEDGDAGDLNDAASVSPTVRRFKCYVISGPVFLYFLQIVWTGPGAGIHSWWRIDGPRNWIPAPLFIRLLFIRSALEEFYVRVFWIRERDV